MSAPALPPRPQPSNRPPVTDDEIAQAQAEVRLGWTDRRLNVAERLYLDATLSASEVAKTLGGITRNAVLGQAMRRGWDRDPSLHRANTRRLAGNVAPVRRAPRPKVEKPELRIVAPRPAEQINFTGPSRSLLELEGSISVGGHECRWPLNDPGRGNMAETRFCGAPGCAAGSPYCDRHMKATGQKAVKHASRSDYARSLRRYV